MDHTYWQKQANNQALFEDLLWSRPENKRLAGKLLVVGGNLHGFAAPAEAYDQAAKAGIGTTKVLLPNALQKTIGQLVENTEFAPSNKSGSFSKQALGEWLAFATWADGVLLAGDLGRNSETAILLESFISKYDGQLTITKDSADYFTNQPVGILHRPQTTLVITIAQLQKLCTAAKWPTPIQFSMLALPLAEQLHQLTNTYAVNLVVLHNDLMFVASGGGVSTTSVPQTDTWRIKTAAHCVVWQIQNPSQPFQALTTAVYNAYKS